MGQTAPSGVTSADDYLVVELDAVETGILGQPQPLVEGIRWGYGNAQRLIDFFMENALGEDL